LANININFPWPVGRRYEIVKPALPKKDNPFAAEIDEPHIRQIGAGQDERQPIATSEELYLKFADLGKAKAAEFESECLKFAHWFGLLRIFAEAGAQEPLSVWRREIKRMRDSIEGLRRAHEEGLFPSAGVLITDVTAQLVPGKPDGGLTLSLRPNVLLDAMRLQMAQSIASGRSIAVCQNCQGWFETGGGRGTGAKRLKATFCSDKCRNDFHYQQRRAKK
jgi:hypothetical protein